MRKLRVSASMHKRLADLRSAQSNSRRGGVMRVPRIATDLDAWEREASAHQDNLIDASYEDRAERSKVHADPVGTGKDPADVSHRYKSDAVR
jgi:hypothetical protein